MKTYALRFNVPEAEDAGELEHPQIVMNELATRFKWDIVHAAGHPIGDCWIFYVRGRVHPDQLPPYIEIVSAKVS